MLSVCGTITHIKRKMKLQYLCIFITMCGESFGNYMPQSKIQEAFCQSLCSAKQTGQSVCYYNTKDCNCTRQNFVTEDVVPSQDNFTFFKLNCKEDDMANFIWRRNNNFAYILEIRYENNLNFSDVTLCGNYTLTSLQEKTTYEIKLWSISNNLISRSKEVKFVTSEKNLTLTPVQNVSVTDIYLEENNIIAVIEWSPNEDLSCYYGFVWMDTEYTIKEVDYHSDLHKIRVENLKPEKQYQLQVYAKSKRSESLRKEYFFTTPPCLTIYNDSLEHCIPEKPENVTFAEKLNEDGVLEKNFTYDIYLNWSKPRLLPHYYRVMFANYIPGTENPNPSLKELNISGIQTSAVFKNVVLAETYQVSLEACSIAGCSEPVSGSRHNSDKNSTNTELQELKSVSKLILIIIGISVLILILIVSVVGFSYYRVKQERKKQRNKYFTELNEKLSGVVDNTGRDLNNLGIADPWELELNKLFLKNVLGEGAFGIVRRASLEMKDGSKMEVAIKMLKDSPSSEEVRQFTHEIEIMKSVRQHPYIVSLIGCITRGRLDGPFLVVEYCSRGDLQSYLRNAWEKFSNMQQELHYADNSDYSSQNYFSNKTYDFHNINLGDEFKIQPKHLLSIARQVALGMEHLAKTRVVHRDLAARNVLVCENHTVKVSDFGLSRDIYQDNVYCKSGGGKLPIRWMALESLTHQRYTTQSDVWSFGILLWEIVTLGGTPYVGVHSCDLLELLKNGYRLKCPATCSDELYEIMQNCWKTSPKDRPTFTEICKSLECLLENVSQYLHLENIDVPLTDKNDDKASQNSCSYERYVKPVNNVK